MATVAMDNAGQPLDVSAQWRLLSVAVLIAAAFATTAIVFRRHEQEEEVLHEQTDHLVRRYRVAILATLAVPLLLVGLGSLLRFMWATRRTAKSEEVQAPPFSTEPQILWGTTSAPARGIFFMPGGSVLATTGGGLSAQAKTIYGALAMLAVVAWIMAKRARGSQYLLLPCFPSPEDIATVSPSGRHEPAPPPTPPPPPPNSHN
jgi:hypothetical protein